MTNDVICALFWRYTMISFWTHLIFFLALKQFWNNIFDAYPNVFIQELFLLFWRTIIIFWCSKVPRLTLILPTKYPSLSGLGSQHPDSIILRKKWIFIHLHIIRNTASNKLFIKVFRGLEALEVLNF